MNEQRLGLVRGRDVSGLPVVSIDEGEDAAEIRDVLYDAVRHDLVGFTLNRRGWFRGTLGEVLRAANVIGIGSHAVMVAGADCLTVENAGPLSEQSPSYDVIGNDVVSSTGSLIGKVVDVIIETGRHPAAVGYEVETDGGTVFVPASAQKGLSGENLVVPQEAEQFTSNDLAGFGASVESFRQLLGDDR